MDLYGDLPPVAGDSNEIVAKGGWANITPNAKQIQPKTIQSFPIAAQSPLTTTSTVTSNEKKMIPISLTSKKLKLLPNALLFKPRQTNIVPSTSAMPIIINNNPTIITNNLNNHIPISLPSTETTVEVISRKRKESFHEIQEPAATSIESTPILPNNSDITSFECEDPYDPAYPNDYIICCEEREEKKRLRLLEQENLILLQQIEKDRQNKEQERVIAIKEGNVSKLSELSVGRGRTQSNLPSWMTSDPNFSKSIQLATESKIQNNENITKLNENPILPHKVGVLQPSCIILIKNIAKIDEFTEFMKEDIIEECRKFGSIENTEVFIVSTSNYSENERIRIFIEYSSQESAVKAYRDLNNRHFNSNIIRVSFYDEDRYYEKDLSPENDI